MNQQNKLKDSFLSFFHDLFDLMVVNWLWLLCCLPIVTIGPATCAMYRITLKLAREEAVYPLRDFWQGFRENWKQGFLLGLLTAALLAVSVGDLYFAMQQTGSLRTLYLAIGILMAAIALTLSGYAFGLQAMFRNPLKNQIGNAFKLAFLSPGKTIAIWLIQLIPVLCAVLLPPVALEMLGFLYLVAGFSGPAYGVSKLLRGIFDRVNGTSAVSQ